MGLKTCLFRARLGDLYVPARCTSGGIYEYATHANGTTLKVVKLHEARAHETSTGLGVARYVVRRRVHSPAREVKEVSHDMEYNTILIASSRSVHVYAPCAFYVSGICLLVV